MGLLDPSMTKARQQLRNWKAEIAIILGSGLNSIVQQPIESLDYTEFSELPRPRVPGHAGKFSLCEVSGKRVIFAQGRVHLYEGYSSAEITASIRTFANAGIMKLIVMNAAGGLNLRFRPGEWARNGSGGIFLHRKFGYRTFVDNAEP